MAPQTNITLYHLFTAQVLSLALALHSTNEHDLQADTLAYMLMKVNSEKPPVRSIVKTVVIGEVPDRGGRPREGKMAAFRPRAAGGPAPAAAGGGHRGHGGGGRGGGGKRNLRESGEKEGKRTRGRGGKNEKN